MHPLCYEYLLVIGLCILHFKYKTVYTNCSKNSELKITVLLVNIIVNTECQHSQNSAVGL